MKIVYEEIKENVQRKELISSTITCNKCKKRVIIDKDSNFDEYTYIQIDNKQFHLCEECFIEFIASFKIAPNGFACDLYHIEDEDDEKMQQYYFEEFKKEEEKKQQNLKRKDKEI